MEHHIWKSAPDTIFINSWFSSPTIEFGNLNIFSLHGAGARHVYDFLPLQGVFDEIVLPIRGKDLFDGCDDSPANRQDLARENVEVVHYLLNRTKEAFSWEYQRETKTSLEVKLQPPSLSAGQAESKEKSRGQLEV